MQANRGHGALARRDAPPLEVRQHVRQAGGEERHVIERAAALQRALVPLAQVFLQALGVVAVDADDVDHRVVRIACVADVDPQARKRKVRPRSDLQAQHLFIKLAARFELDRANGKVVQ